MAGVIRIRIKKAILLIVSILALGGSLYFAALCLSDASGSQTFCVRSTETGNLLCGFTALTFALAVEEICRMFDRRLGDLGVVTVLMPHAAAVASLLIETLTVTNFFNHSMELLTSDFSVAVLLIYALTVTCMSAESLRASLSRK